MFTYCEHSSPIPKYGHGLNGKGWLWHLMDTLSYYFFDVYNYRLPILSLFDLRYHRISLSKWDILRQISPWWGTFIVACKQASAACRIFDVADLDFDACPPSVSEYSDSELLTLPHAGHREGTSRLDPLWASPCLSIVNILKHLQVNNLS